MRHPLWPKFTNHNPVTFNRLKGMPCRERLNACKEYRKNPDGSTKPTLFFQFNSPMYQLFNKHNYISNTVFNTILPMVRNGRKGTSMRHSILHQQKSARKKQVLERFQQLHEGKKNYRRMTSHDWLLLNKCKLCSQNKHDIHEILSFTSMSGKGS